MENILFEVTTLVKSLHCRFVYQRSNICFLSFWLQKIIVSNVDIYILFCFVCFADISIYFIIIHFTANFTLHQTLVIHQHLNQSHNQTQSNNHLLVFTPHYMRLEISKINWVTLIAVYVTRCRDLFGKMFTLYLQ